MMDDIRQPFLKTLDNELTMAKQQASTVIQNCNHFSQLLELHMNHSKWADGEITRLKKEVQEKDKQLELIQLDLQISQQSRLALLAENQMLGLHIIHLQEEQSNGEETVPAEPSRDADDA